MSLEGPSGTRSLGSNSEEIARPSCGSEMDRSSYSSEDTERSTCGSDVIMIDDTGLETKTLAARNLNVVNSKGILVGTQRITVTQNVEKVKVVKDLSLHRYIWNLITNTSRVEKVSCCTAMFVLIVCIMLVIYFVVITDETPEQPETDSDEWFQSREQWLAVKYNRTSNFTDNRLVIIAHTAGAACYTPFQCSGAVKSLQKHFLNSFNYDIPYSFLIGGDGRVYEGRGWNIVGAHTLGYNTCSTGVAFMGDYREGPSYTNFTELQIKRAHMLFEKGVKNGYLNPNFHVLGAMDLRPTSSPGTKLYNEIRTWANYDHENLYKDKSCRQIREMFEDDNPTSTTS